MLAGYPQRYAASYNSPKNSLAYVHIMYNFRSVGLTVLASGFSH